MSAITFETVSLRYGSHDVVYDLDTEIESGSVTGIIGLNGAGKTTLIKAALGLREVSAGRICVYGYEAGGSQAKKCLTYLPEHFLPPEFLSGYEFIDFVCRFYQGNPDRSTVLAYGATLGLDNATLSMRVHTYSKGMRQKLGIMGAVLADAPCLVLDEPMSGLDPEARITVKGLIKQAHGQGKTIVLSSHILADMDEICDTLLVVDDKRLKFSGTPSELKRQSMTQNLEKGFLALVGDTAA